MKKKKLSLNKLFQNNKFLIILSIVISTITWVYMSMGTTNDTTVTISNIPIQIELPDQLDNNGLQVFRDAEQTATVTVTGSRAVLGSIGTKDITVTGATNGIDSAGTYQLSLSAVKANPSANFQIISTVTPSNVNVIVDYQRETSFPIQENVVYKVADGYYASTSLASKNITISGPQTEIAKIAKVSASIIVPVAAISESMVSRSNTSKAPVFEREKRTAVSAASTIDFSTAFFHSSPLWCLVNIFIYFL